MIINSKNIWMLTLLFSLFALAYQNLKANSDNIFKDAQIRLDKDGKTPLDIRFIENKQISVSSFFKEYKSTFNLSEDNTFKLFKVTSDQLSQTHHRYKQYFKNIEIAEIQYLLHERNGSIFYAHGKFIHDLKLSVTPSLTEAEALKFALNHINAEAYMWENNEHLISGIKDPYLADICSYPKGELKISAPMEKMNTEKFVLVYRFDIFAKKPFRRYCVDVDANTGEIVKVLPKMYSGDVLGEGLSLYNGMVPIITDSVEGTYRLRESSRGGGIETYDALNQTDLMSAVDFIDEDNIFTEQNAQAGVSVHWATEATYDYYLQRHGRNSYNNSGGKLVSYAHYGYNIGNAYYFGSGRMVYSDGSGSVGPWVSVDWVGHEITHGVTATSAGLGGSLESRALNESFSDMFATAIEFYLPGETGDWLIGEHNFNNGVRSLIDPKSKLHPDTYLGEYWSDYAHGNGGVQNHWFYLLSEGGSGINDNNHVYSVAGIGIEEAAQIAYRNLTVYLMPSSEYYNARLGSLNAAIDLFGTGSQQVQSVISAWYAVGVYLPYIGPYAQNCSLNASYLVPGIDTLFFTCEAVNPDNHSLELNAIIESFDLSISDTIPMYDDGFHNDSTAGDGLFGNIWAVIPGERNYKLQISTVSLDSGYYNALPIAAHFTTIGPVVFEDYRIASSDTIPHHTEKRKFEFTLRNNGLTAVATNITSQIVSLDTFSIIYPLVTSEYSNIQPDSTAVGNRKQYIKFDLGNEDSVDVKFRIDISSNDYFLFWSDTFSVFVHKDPTGIDTKDENLPNEFALKQNYPNPFNPKTTIEFSIPRTEFVSVKIYNILGQEVVTLVSDRLTPGNYKYTWDASGFASGIYYYRLNTDIGFVQTRKLIVLK